LEKFEANLGKSGYIWVKSSGVARVPYALGQGIILRPLSTKTTEFEVKNRCKSCGRSKNSTFTVVIL